MAYGRANLAAYLGVGQTRHASHWNADLLSQRNGHEYGDDANDTREYLRTYSETAGYLVTQFADAICQCGGRAFGLSLDENQGAAVRTCTRCGASHPIGDSADYLEEAELEECACPCGQEALELTIGVALYRDSEDVRWLYIGARCSVCGLAGCYGDWKNEFIGYKELLAQA